MLALPQMCWQQRTGVAQQQGSWELPESHGGMTIGGLGMKRSWNVQDIRYLLFQCALTVAS